jgi:phospholipase/carboxylesterase
VTSLLQNREHNSHTRVINGFAHRFVPAPRGKLGDAATLLLLHGTGGNENDLIPLGKEVGENFSLLSPRGKVLEGNMPRFFRRLAEGVFDIEDLKFRTRELADFVEASSKEYHFDPQRVVALGYSNGANIAASVMLLRPEVLLGTVLFRAMLPLVPEKFPDLSGKQVFLSSGEYDQIIPSQQVQELAQLLRKLGAEVTLNWTQSDHSLTQEELTKAKQFLKTHYS